MYIIWINRDNIKQIHQKMINIVNTRNKYLEHQPPIILLIVGACVFLNWFARSVAAKRFKVCVPDQLGRRTLLPTESPASECIAEMRRNATYPLSG